MSKISTVLLVVLLFTSLASADRYDLHVAQVRGGERAVLVLCPGMNQNGSFFLEEPDWVEFAQENEFGLIALSYQSNPSLMYGVERKGYYWPDQGSGQVLLEEIRESYGTDLPILIYGFSGGAHFASRFTEWAPERVLGWAAYSAQFWDSPTQSDLSPAGVVACGELDALRWFPSFSYFYEGRELGKPWTWITLRDTGHHRKGSLEEFIRCYFVVLSNDEMNSGLYLDVDSKAEVSLDEIMQPELVSWLPSRDLVDVWKEVHQP